MPHSTASSAKDAHPTEQNTSSDPSPPDADRAARIRTKNRRRRYLSTHPEYFSSSSLELASPLLYDLLIRRFQSPLERKAEDRTKGLSGVIEADILRSEAKLAALSTADPNTLLSYKRGANGEIVAEEKDGAPSSKEEGMERWRRVMELRFVRGEDGDFDYGVVDESEEWDDAREEQREREEVWFGEEEARWVGDEDEDGREGREITGETGVQDF